MTYLVMETHPAYAVVLDEAGRFLKVANRGYQPGDRVTDVIPLRAARLTPLRFAPALTAAAGLAACLVGASLVLFVWFYPVLSGLPVPTAWAASTLWLPSWGFYWV